MKTISIKEDKIKGWGIDANPKNDPTYPMKHRTNEEHNGYSWKRPTQQSDNVEILHSNERPNLSAVFGTTYPPKGLSGWIRRIAFKYSENRYRHWLPLLIADRVNVIEGLIDDLKHGHLPNYFSEKGLGILWKYKKKTFLQRVAIRALAATAIFAWMFKKKNPIRETRRW